MQLLCVDSGFSDRGFVCYSHYNIRELNFKTL